MYDDDDEPEGPKSSFTTYLSEGNVHFNQGEYKKALDSYTQVYYILSFYNKLHCRYRKTTYEAHLTVTPFARFINICFLFYLPVLCYLIG